MTLALDRPLDRPQPLVLPVHLRLSTEERREIIQRARLLPEKDQLIVEFALEKEFSFRQMAMILHLPAGTIWKRLKSALRRLRDPHSSILTARSCLIAPELRLLGIDHFVKGHPSNVLAETYQIPKSRVKQSLQFIRGYCKGALAARDAILRGRCDD